jgi:short-subunit dehydrogenase
MSHYFITGASSGIGYALAVALAKNGNHVSVVARRKDRLQQLKNDFPKINIFSADVTDSVKMQQVIEECISHSGMPDCAILNAGKYTPLGGDQIDISEFCDHMMVNYMGVIHALNSFVPNFKNRGFGHIVIMGSTAGYRGLPKSAAYGPTKAALTNLAEALYLDLSAYSIKVQLISPGFVETDATAVNEFKMPQLMSSEDAAKQIIKGLDSNRFEICFPSRFAFVMKILKLLPYFIYFRLIKWATK